jgi:hypothetical protein
MILANLRANRRPRCEQMTVAVNDTIERYVIAGAGPYAYTWRIFNDTDLQVYALSTASPPVPTLLTYLTHYTVAGANEAAGGSITLTAAAIAAYTGFTLDIRANTPRSQPTSIRNQARFLPEIHEDAFDYLDRQIQDMGRLVDASIRIAGQRSCAADDSAAARPTHREIPGLRCVRPADRKSSGTGNDSALRADLAKTTVAADGVRLIGYRRNAAGSIAESLGRVLDRTLHLEDFGTNTTPSTTDMAVAWQAAIDNADSTDPVVHFTHENATSKPLLIRSTSVENLVFRGEARTVSILMPTAIDIKQPAQNINCLIFNQCDNGHAHFQHMRFFSNVAYTGQIIYAVEGGGADGSGQAMFSAVFEDVWCSLSSQNTGYFRGGFSNLKANNMVYESVKDACWILEGAGNGDLTFVNHQMFICFDNFIRASDANDKAIITVLLLHAYSHLRGRLIEVNKGKGLLLGYINLEPDAANLGDVGLFKLTDCSNILATNFTMATRTGVPAGAVGIDLINGATGKFMNGRINATTGLKFSGAGVVDLEFVNVDFTGCSDCISLGGTQSGRVRFLRCKFNDAQLRCFVHVSGTPTINWEFDQCELLNAGLANVAGRNIDLSLTGGSATFRDCRIGQNTGSALAAYYISNGSAAVLPKYLDCEFVGTPPTGLTDAIAANMPVFLFRRGLGTTVASAANISLPFDGNIVTVSGAVGITSITATFWKGNVVTLWIPGNLTVTDGSNLKLAGNFVSGANGGTLTLANVDNTNWLEVSRAVH